MSEIIIRKMRPEEAGIVQKLGRKSFLGFESLFITKPKDALVAEIDGKIVSGVMTKIVKGSQNTKVGYVDIAFVDRAYHNQGIGNKIYKASIDYLWNEGCEFITAMVKDDNIGSFALLEKNGLARVNFYEANKVMGIKGFLNQFLYTALGYAYGMDFYLASNKSQQSPKPKQEKNINQIGVYLGINIGFLLAATILSGNFSIGLLGAYLTLLASSILSGGILTCFSKREWKYRFLNGGIIFPIISMIMGGLFPMGGNWYPKRYEHTNEFHKEMGLNAAFSWIVLLILTYGSSFFDKSNLYFFNLNQIGVMFVLFRVIGCYPLSSFGGRRVFIWNKAVYLILSLLSVLLVIF